MENKYTLDSLRQFQSLPLSAKINMARLRIKAALTRFDGKCYIAFSGGKDSTVLKHLIDEMTGGTVPAVFINTGLEWPEVRRFAMAQPNVTVIKPKLTFKEVLERYGYPVISKEQSSFIYEYRHSNSAKLRDLRWNGRKGAFKISDRWKYLTAADFEISNKCCDVMKKEPARRYEKETGRVPFIATLACESLLRQQNWVRYGCNAFDATRPTSRPLSVWTDQDILTYIHTYNVPISPVYGQILECPKNGLILTGEQRTGCMFCMYGVHLESEPNKFQRMRLSHPKQWAYCMDELGLAHVLDTIKVKYN